MSLEQPSPQRILEEIQVMNELPSKADKIDSSGQNWQKKIKVSNWVTDDVLQELGKKHSISVPCILRYLHSLSYFQCQLLAVSLTYNRVSYLQFQLLTMSVICSVSYLQFQLLAVSLTCSVSYLQSHLLKESVTCSLTYLLPCAI